MRACVLVLLLAGWVVAEDLSLPDKVALKPGRLAKIAAKGDGKTVKWLNPDPENFDLIPSESGRWVIVSAVKPGVYRLAAWTAKDGEPTEAAICVVTVGQPQPPPDPPPTDPLAVELRRLYDADSSPGELKRQVAAQLVALYRQAAALAEDAGLLNVGMYHEAIKAKSGGVGQGLTALRQRVGVELAGVLGQDATMEFSRARRTAAAALFDRLVKMLEAMP